MPSVASFSCLLGTAAITQAATVTLPSCGNDPSTNTKMLQAKIDLANPGDTLVLPAGVCVVAKCEIAHGQICYGVAGRHFSALHIGNKSDLTVIGAADGTSVLKLDSTPPRRADGYHAYCGDTHVLSVQLSRFVSYGISLLTALTASCPRIPASVLPTRTATREKLLSTCTMCGC